ncbi:MAG: CBU_0592 family membrane protein [Nanoarchaeota archaeon]
MNSFQLIGALGLVFIIFGTFLISAKKKFKRKFIYPLLLLGGICLEIYSIYIKDTIFIILQGVYILVTIYGLIKLNEIKLKKIFS